MLLRCTDKRGEPGGARGRKNRSDRFKGLIVDQGEGETEAEPDRLTDPPSAKTGTEFANEAATPSSSRFHSFKFPMSLLRTEAPSLCFLSTQRL